VKQRLLIVLFTALVFGAGFAAHMWIQDDGALPPPPATPGGEFVHAPPAPTANTKADNRHGPDRAKMIADIAQLRPQIDAYRSRLDAIEAEFQRDFVPILDATQKEHYDAFSKKRADERAKKAAKEKVGKVAADAELLTDEQIDRLRQRPLWNALYSVAITWPFDRLNAEYKLDPAQQAKLRDLLRVRREKFLDLVDSTPPPSITLSELARQTQKLVEPAKAGK
jgi:hypothetical protein